MKISKKSLNLCKKEAEIMAELTAKDNPYVVQFH